MAYLFNILPPIHIIQFIVLLKLIQIPLYLSSGEGCDNLFTCGNITQIGFPFWGEDRPKECGYPLLQLSCVNNISYITINDVKYRVLEANSFEHTLRITREDYLQGLCPAKYVNTTLDTKIFVYGSKYNNLTFFYDCPLSITFPSPFGHFPCSSNGFAAKYVYIWFGPNIGLQASSCQESISVPISNSSVDVSDSTKIQSAVRDGFVVKWIAGTEDCEKCKNSSGFCGYDWMSKQTTCYCRDQSCSSPPQQSQESPHPGSKHNRRLIVIGAVGFGVTMFFIIVITISCFLKRGTGRQQKSIFRKRRKLVEHNVDVFMQNYNLSMPRRYSYTEIKRITNSFREKLGQGGYGVVYKASLFDSRLVAVKVIKESKGSGEEFINEVASISRTSHMNIVSLFGYCYEGNKRALIYEFMSKGSLDKFIYKSEFPNAICDFDWNTLFQIAIGIARGLEYLHQGCNSRILHLDIKPQNILLDEDFCPKISDFGLAKICQKKDSIVSILGARGTIGYMAPEIFSRAFGGVSYKSDVYSYGMLILEMIGGRKNYDTGGSSTSEMYFPDWIYKDLEQGNTSNTLLNNLTISEEENDMVRKITLVSLWCIQTNPSDRPAMNKVIEMLLGPLSSVSYPPKPVLFSPERPALPVECISSSDFNETSSITVSK
ncbi:LEAF RUST 10 DISEASE-RESISTANCE LOCUS RECEPTOR-LIKE PROTEIN KINASE-like 2.4 [Vicia villosa]|uniref:LEAF RUST 10 DISEASE-RESISTANCE LOCUS RECEPTOR-LIKE PROTEIN KINASE-like 2.4 n=1 Tax=Vicia villosa TaxID=3911 RepID=UPI00273B9C57|nr:LEAF RUST 10 DISEASE-RESISTANCE LOCUS RECEPTOR-LIKE PROTEIN KINASE-like 2.4 [Vicia villosa]